MTHQRKVTAIILFFLFYFYSSMVTLMYFISTLSADAHTSTIQYVYIILSAQLYVM